MGRGQKERAGTLLPGGEVPAAWQSGLSGLCELTQGSLILQPLHGPKATLHSHPREQREGAEGSCHPSPAPLFFGLATLWELCPRSLEAFFEIPAGGWGCRSVHPSVPWCALPGRHTALCPIYSTA